MGRKSSVKRLPPEVLREVNRLLTEGRATLDEILAHLRKLGVDEVSRSALGRHRQQFEKVAAKLRQGREMTESLVRELGPDAAEGRQGRVLVEILRNLVNDCLMNQLEDGAVLDPKTLQTLSRATRELSQAIRMDQDYESKIRERVEKEVAERMEKAVADVVGSPASAGFSPQQVITAIRNGYTEA